MPFRPIPFGMAYQSRNRFGVAMRALLALLSFCFFAALAIKSHDSGRPEAKPVFAPSLGAETPMPAARPTALSVKPADPESAFREAAPAAPVATAARPVRPAAASDSPCTDLLAENIAAVQFTHAASGLSGGDLCGDEAPVRLAAVRLRDGSSVELLPAVLAKCGMALEFARWVRDDVAEAARLSGGALRRIAIAASYSCRPRNNIKGQKLSEHGLANAVDISAITLADGRTFTIFSPLAPAILLANIRASACTRFTTVLGPGADAAHANHIHLDLAQRRGDYRICQWNLPDWPLP